MSDERVELNDRRSQPDTHWLVPMKTPLSNAVLRGPTEGIGDLDCELTKDPQFGSVVTDSAWEMDDEQRRRVAAGAHVRLGVWQHPIPPLSVEIEAPFCASCGAAKVWVSAASEYACGGACPERDPRFPPVALPDESPLEQAHRDFSPED